MHTFISDACRILRQYIGAAVLSALGDFTSLVKPASIAIRDEMTVLYSVSEQEYVCVLGGESSRGQQSSILPLGKAAH